MRISDELERFDAALFRLSPESAAELGPPADDNAFARLESAIAPFTVPNEVRALYEWHDGGNFPAFAGRVFLSIDEAINQRESLMTLLDEPPSWLPLFTEGSGGRFFVEALHPDGSVEPGLWVKGKDYGPHLVYSSLTALFDVLASLFEDGTISVVTNINGYREFEPTSDEHFQAVKRSLDPEPIDLPRNRTFFPTMEWPSSWLAALGVDKAASTPTGDSASPIAEVIVVSADRPGTYTISGKLKTLQKGADLFWITVDDGSGLALVVFEGEPSRLLDWAGRVEVEVDIEAGPTVRRPDGVRPDMRAGHPVKGLAIRLHEPEFR